MFRLIKFLIYGDFHLHSWESIEEEDLFNEKNQKIGVVFTDSCRKCKLKRVRKSIG